MKHIKELKYALDDIIIDGLEVNTNEIVKQLEQIRKKENISDKEFYELLKYEDELRRVYKKEAKREEEFKKDITKEEHKKIKINKAQKDYRKKKKEKERVNIPEPVYKIDITNNKKEAYISLYNIPEKFEITPEALINLLNNNKVVRGILYNKIFELIEKIKKEEKVENFLIALGKEPEKGNKAYIKFFIKNNKQLSKKYLKEKHPELNEEVLEEELKKRKIKAAFVKKGEIIAEKIIATKGADGYTVTGETIPGIRGDDYSLEIKRNVIFDEATRTYKAEVDGEAIIEGAKIWVKLYKAGKFRINISEDEMKVYLTVYPSIGGAEPVKPENIINELNKLGIVAPIKKEKIYETISKSEEEHKVVYNVIIAEGEKPINGKNGYIEYKIKLATGKKFKELSTGRIDFKEKDLITTVRKKDLIAILHKPESAIQDGLTVRGKVIPAEDGKELKINIGKNIYVDERDNKIYFYSEIDGHLKTDFNTISVLPVYIVKGDINFKTGNIRFPGDVIVKGDVLDDFKIIAEGDVMIYGNVGAALISSEMDIIVKQGIFGKGTGKLFAKGSLFAKFIENGLIEVMNDIIVDRAIINSYVYANNNIIVKKEKGQIIGGKIFAGKKIEAKIIGSESGVKTELYLGYNFILKKESESIKEERRKYSKDLEKIENIIEKLFKEAKDINSFNEEMKKIYVESLRKKAVILSYLHQLEQKERVLTKEQLIICEQPEVIIYDTLFTDVKIHFFDYSFLIKQKHYNVKVRLDYKNNITYEAAVIKKMAQN